MALVISAAVLGGVVLLLAVSAAAVYAGERFEEAIYHIDEEDL